MLDYAIIFSKDLILDLNNFYHRIKSYLLIISKLICITCHVSWIVTPNELITYYFGFNTLTKCPISQPTNHSKGIRKIFLSSTYLVTLRETVLFIFGIWLSMQILLHFLHGSGLHQSPRPSVPHKHIALGILGTLGPFFWICSLYFGERAPLNVKTTYLSWKETT